MAIGFVLINTLPTYEHEVYNKLSKLTQIIELHPCFGDYDIIAKIEAKDFEQIGNLIVNRIRCISGVKDTKTLTVTKRLK